MNLETIDSINTLQNGNKESTIDVTYNEILNKSSLISSSSEGLFNILKGLHVVTSELCIIYGTEKTAEYLHGYMNSEEIGKGNFGNLFDFISYIEPNKKERTKLYKKLSEQSLENIVHNEKNTDGYFDNESPAAYKLKLSGAIAEGKNLDTLLGKISNFKSIFDFSFHTSDLERFGFYEKLGKSDGNIIKLLNELRKVLVNEEEEKLETEIEPLLVKIEQRLILLKKEINQIEQNLLHSANQSRDDFNSNFSLKSTDELDDLVKSGIEAFKNHMENLQKSADDIKYRIQKEVQDLNEKKSFLLHIK